MRTAKDWKEFEVIDTSDGEKLERWGDVVLVRPDPQVIWDTTRTVPQWKRYDAFLQRRRQMGDSLDVPRTVDHRLQTAAL